MKPSDSAGNEFKAGDIVRMFHFIGARNRKYYMYKKLVSIDNIINGHVVLNYRSLTEDHLFQDVDNKMKEVTLIVQRSPPYHLDDLKKNPKLRD